MYSIPIFKMSTSVETSSYELIDRACEQITAAINGPEEEKKLSAALSLLVKAASIIKSVPGAGKYATLRWRIYQLMQAQEGDDNAALYKELRCSIHLGLAGETSDPITLPCGHSFCKTCIAPFYFRTTPANMRVCPQCRASITVSYDSLKPSVAIMGITNHLLPIGTTHDQEAIAAIEAQVVRYTAAPSLTYQPGYEFDYDRFS